MQHDKHPGGNYLEKHRPVQQLGSFLFDFSFRGRFLLLQHFKMMVMELMFRMLHPCGIAWPCRQINFVIPSSQQNAENDDDGHFFMAPSIVKVRKTYNSNQAADNRTEGSTRMPDGE